MDGSVSRRNGIDGMYNSQSEISPLLTRDSASDRLGIHPSGNASDASRGQARRSTQYLASIIATIGGFIAGTCLAWTSPAEETFKHGVFGYTASDDEFAWVGSIMPLGAMTGCVITASFVDIVGRKSLMIMLIVPCFVGWLTMVFSYSVLMMCTGRFLTGIATGSYCILCPMYTAEIGQKEIRGTLGTFLQLQITIGILFTYVVGAFVNAYWLAIICAIFPIIYLCLMLVVPKTPYFYVLKRRLSEAQNSLTWLRGNLYDARHELTMMQRTIEDDEANKVPFLRAFQTAPAKRGLLIGLGIMFLQQFSGCNAITFYSDSIFKAAGTSIDSSLSTMIIGIIQVLSTWIGTMVVDQVGRRILLLLSIVVMTLSTFTLGLYFYLKYNANEDVSDISWLPLLSLSSYIIIFSLGFGPIPWMLMAEIFPSKIRSAACSLAGLFNWTCVFIITKSFPILKVQLGPGFTFWCFTLCSGLGIFFVLFVVPETKGKTLLEIQQILGDTGIRSPNPIYSSN